MRWTIPLARQLRSGFEITGYALARQRTTWTVPIAKQLRSGFEVTGYALTR